MRFGDFIKQKRLSHPDELTLKGVSQLLGISLSFLSDVENNRRKPFDKIELFAERLGLTEGTISIKCPKCRNVLNIKLKRAVKKSQWNNFAIPSNGSLNYQMAGQ
ncbi:MAG: helix-turn-helix transcriptional regulator [Desulfitobacteriaceae bacterium]|nr:helix-turn-helix transcriptional regulator [Desulfitobacteriaceae bacterium]MDD4347115.1 helix-turn-helix transcriptional regulator [Desulfitobacteriaceae bacterium]MDD4402627.1 helix-turn-helix transcriptional regulator [Desulfitobacteriaceae bacterium]